MKFQADPMKEMIKLLNSTIKTNKGVDGRDNKSMLLELFAKENEFKTILLSTGPGRKMYDIFVDEVLQEGDFLQNAPKENYRPKNKKDMAKFKAKTDVETRGILKARVFFRERQGTFTKKMFKAFYDRKPEQLHPLKINFLFATWVMERYKGGSRIKLEALYKEIQDLRRKLCENNLPLALNRARLFWDKSSGSVVQIEKIDLVQSCAEGLLTAIDKFVPPYRSVFSSVAIGRMTLNMMDANNDTAVKLSPKSRRVLYRMKNAIQREKLTDKREILAYVRESFKDVDATALEEIAMASGFATSLDETIADPAQPSRQTFIHETIASEIADPEETATSSDVKGKMMKEFEELDIIERKAILLKTGDIYE